MGAHALSTQYEPDKVEAPIREVVGMKTRTGTQSWKGTGETKTMKPVATLTLHGVKNMTIHERLEIEYWIHNQIDNMHTFGDEYATQFTARYYQ